MKASHIQSFNSLLHDLSVVSEEEGLLIARVGEKTADLALREHEQQCGKISICKPITVHQTPTPFSVVADKKKIIEEIMMYDLTQQWISKKIKVNLVMEYIDHTQIKNYNDVRINQQTLVPSIFWRNIEDIQIIADMTLTHSIHLDHIFSPCIDDEVCEEGGKDSRLVISYELLVPSDKPIPEILLVGPDESSRLLPRYVIDYSLQ